MQYIYTYLFSTFMTFIIDMLWLGYFAKSFYHTALQGLLRIENNQLQPIWWAAAGVYLVIGLGIVVFVLPKAQGQALSALLYGALFGFVCYAIYDFTNYAILASWPIKMVMVDICWGAILCASTAWLTYLFNQWLTN